MTTTQETAGATTRRRRAARADMPDPLAPPAAAPAQAALVESPTEPGNDEARRDIATINSQLKEFDAVAAGLAELERKFAHVAYDCTVPEQLEQAKAARKEIQTPRFKVEQVRVAAKAPVLKLGRSIDARAGEIKTRLLAIEAPIDEQITAWETREKRRKDDLLARIAELRNTPRLAIGKTVDELAGILESIETFPLVEFAEFREQAAAAQQEAQRAVAQLLQQAREATEARAELKRQQDEADRVAGIRARIEAIKKPLETLRQIKSAAMVQRVAETIKTGTAIDETFAEFKAEAEAALAHVLAEFERVRAEKAQAEADRLELETLRAQVAAAPKPTEPPPAPVATAAPAPAPVEPAATYLPLATALAQARPSAPSSQPAVSEAALPSLSTSLAAVDEAPSAEEIVAHLAGHYDEDETTVVAWLEAMNFTALRASFAAA